MGEKEMGPKPERKTSKLLQIIIPIVIGLIIAFIIPNPEGLPTNAWYYFAAFVTIILSVALEALPMGAIGLIGISFIAIFNLLGKSGKDTLSWAISGFSNSVVWLVFAAMIFAVALKDTGIGRRIALFFIKILGKTSLGLGYAVTLADFCLGPFMPSNTARSFGTMYPITRATAEALDSHPGESAGKIGSFLLFTSFTATFISSSTFLTAAAMTVLGIEYIAAATGFTPISWMGYLVGFIPQALILLATTPLIAYKFFPPEIKKFPQAPNWAAEQLKEMGKFSKKEITTLIIFLFALIAWISLDDIFPPAMVAIMAVSAMLLTKVITWEQVIEEKSAWNIVMVLGTLITLANGLKDVGFLEWVSQASAAYLVGLALSPVVIMILLALIDFLLHYLYVSITAHVTTLMPLWLAVVSAIPGFPVQLFGMLLIHTKEGFGALTPYGAGHGVGFLLSGYFPDHKKFWKAESFWAYTYFALMVVSIPYWLWLYGWM
ncbi:DASS family sodium-coupled anion symporter [Desulfitobacterium chlororespirans]|uniref:L-tartrate/succinate antiporter n=1 Tax=Desulfitobacterium chlororespirans DSM 11544 TaxID=1121395 RepID=A0A1M7RS11_9FIRM|nr:DASS family sodium-coupled anion symporter [Desulfitobacterium chlororespirans]SHN49014.1 L-tartrate/succinate antiporter [Desulfitobacterium chlororespirans DSM 11544]